VNRLLALVVLATCLVAPGQAAPDTTPPPTAAINPAAWTLARQKVLSSRRPTETDMVELLSRLAIVAHGEDLSPEALRRTIARANDLSGGYGVLDNGGTKRIFAIYVLTAYEQTQRLRQCEHELARQQEELQALKTELSQLRAAIAKDPHGAGSAR
jgi:hypothetical protein